MWQITIALAFLACFLSAYYWFSRKTKQNIFKKLDIKGPEPNFLLGNLNSFQDKCLHVVYQEWTKKYGRIYGYYEGPTPVIVTSDLEFLKQVFIKQFSNFHARKLLPIQPDPDSGREINMFHARGDRWKRLRTIINPTFSTVKMRQMSPMINDSIDIFLEKINEKSNSGKEAIDVYSTIKCLTLDVIGKCAFGMEVNAQSNPDHPFVSRCQTIFKNIIQTPLLTIVAILFPEIKQILWSITSFMRHFKEDANFWLMDQLGQVIQLRQQGTQPSRVDLVQLMIDAKKYPIRDRRTSQLTMTADVDQQRSSSGTSNSSECGNDHDNWYKVHSLTTLDSANNNVENPKGQMCPGGSQCISGVCGTGAVSKTIDKVDSSQKSCHGHRDIAHAQYDIITPDDVFEEKRKTSKQGLTEDEIKAQSVLFLLAGYETVSASLTYAVYELALNMDVQKKLQLEIDDHFPDMAIPTYQTVNALPYLDMVTRETLRMYPTGSQVISRLCMEDCEINGVQVPKGMTIQADVWSIHYDQEYWGAVDTKQFYPERFSPENKATHHHPLAFMSFGAGPRNCVGMRFAYMELKITLVRLLQKYTIEPCEQTQIPLILQTGATVTPKGDVIVKFIPRS